MKAMILAAGEGRRLRPLTEKIPKSMLKIKGKPLLYYQLRLLKKHGIKDVVINLNYRSEKIKTYLGRKKLGVNIHYSHEKKLLGTAGGVKKAENFFDKDFFVIYGDIITDINLKKIYEFHKKNGGMATICLHKIGKNQPSSSIVIMDNKKQIKEFIEKPAKNDLRRIKGKYKYANSGIYVLNRKIFDFIEKNSFSDFALDIFPKLLKEKKKILGYVHGKCYWAEIGRLDKYKAIKKELEEDSIKIAL